jgi:type II secretory ATPase GspE/PulE/Tfp pilus assembly ATPase PilB-like protein
VECGDKGYRGRVALYEFFTLNDEIADAIDPNVKAGRLREIAAQHGWRSLRDQAWTKVQSGIISIEEQQRLTYRINMQAQPK